MFYPCSSHWGLPARHRQSPGSLLPALEEENQPGLTESHLLDHEGLACWERGGQEEKAQLSWEGFKTQSNNLRGNKEGSREHQRALVTPGTARAEILFTCEGHKHRCTKVDHNKTRMLHRYSLFHL